MFIVRLYEAGLDSRGTPFPASTPTTRVTAGALGPSQKAHPKKVCIHTGHNSVPGKLDTVLDRILPIWYYDDILQSSERG